MEELMKDILKMIESMVKDMNSYQIIRYMKECILMENQKEWVNLIGQMVKVMKGVG